MNNLSTNFSGKPGITVFKNICPGRVATISIAAIMFVTGLLGNILVLRFARIELRYRWARHQNKIDKMLLLKFSYNNLFALCIGLPLHVLDLEVSPLNLLPNVFSLFCAIRTITLFMSLFMGLAILVLICYDRFETLTKMQQERKLTESNTKKILYAIFYLVPVTTLLFGFGYVYSALSGRSQCEMYNLMLDNEGNIRRITNFIIIGLVTVWQTVCNTIYSQVLRAVGKKIKSHIQQIRSILGNQQTVKEIRFVKVAILYVAAFSFIWIPFGVARGLKNFYDTYFINCLYLTTFTTSYFVFSVIPLIYLAHDKRFVVKHWRPFQNRVRQEIIRLPRATHTYTVDSKR